MRLARVARFDFDIGGPELQPGLGPGGSSRWKGGGQVGDQREGFQGTDPPGGGCKGAAPPCVGKFCISELNLSDLVHTFCHRYIENLLIFFQ